MNKAFALALVASMPLTAACSGSTDSNAPTIGGDATTTTSTGAGGTTGGGGSAGTGGSAPMGDVVTLKMDEFPVAKGEEVYKCQNFANPFGGQGDIQEFASHMSAGSHHMLLFYEADATDGPLEDCSGLEFQATPYGSQQPDDSLTFPPGVAASFPSNYGIRLQAHYLNTTADAITAKVEVDFTMAEPGTVQQYAGVLFMVQTDIHVPPHETQTVTRDCSVPFDMNVIKASSHMHQHGINFTSTVANQPFFDTTAWSDPVPELFSPAKPLTNGDPIHFACTFENAGDTTLTFGESAQTNEMCILTASFYPVLDPSQVTVDCN
jgi:hypothetical protein